MSNAGALLVASVMVHSGGAFRVWNYAYNHYRPQFSVQTDISSCLAFGRHISFLAKKERHVYAPCFIILSELEIVCAV